MGFTVPAIVILHFRIVLMRQSMSDPVTLHEQQYAQQDIFAQIGHGPLHTYVTNRSTLNAKPGALCDIF